MSFISFIILVALFVFLVWAIGFVLQRRNELKRLIEEDNNDI